MEYLTGEFPSIGRFRRLNDFIIMAGLQNGIGMIRRVLLDLAKRDKYFCFPVLFRIVVRCYYNSILSNQIVCLIFRQVKRSIIRRIRLVQKVVPDLFYTDRLSGQHHTSFRLSGSGICILLILEGIGRVKVGICL